MPSSAAPPPTWHLGAPPATTPTSVLWDVAAADATHAWAVGVDAYTPPDLYTTGDPLLLQWDGAEWSRVPLPDILWKGSLRLVAAASAADVWAVGGPASHDIDDIITKVLHYDGTTWHEVPFPAGNIPSTMSITGLTAVAGHVWLVGHRNSGVVIQEWDGTVWQERQPPAECVRGGPSGGMPNFCTFAGVLAFAPDDVWACGNGAWAGFFGPLLYHWDGTEWRTVQVGINGQPLALQKLGGRSPSDLWAVGDTVMQGGGSLAVHGDGNTWQVVDGLPRTRLSGVTVDTAGNPWLIENFPAPSAALATYSGGGSWPTTPALPPAGTLGMNLNGIAAVPGTEVMFAVGAADLPTNPRTLQAVILEYSPRPPA